MRSSISRLMFGSPYEVFVEAEERLAEGADKSTLDKEKGLVQY